MASQTTTPLDLETFTGQNPNGAEHPSVEFSMRRGLVHIYGHLGQPNLVLASHLVSVVLAEPMAIFENWMDLVHRGFPRNVMYTRQYRGPEVVIGNVRVPVPTDRVVFGLIADQERRIVDYDWFEGCEIPGFPMGHDDPEVIGGLLWRLN